MAGKPSAALISNRIKLRVGDNRIVRRVFRQASSNKNATCPNEF